jgi:hypothetical protein
VQVHGAVPEVELDLTGTKTAAIDVACTAPMFKAVFLHLASQNGRFNALIENQLPVPTPGESCKGLLEIISSHLDGLNTLWDELSCRLDFMANEGIGLNDAVTSTRKLLMYVVRLFTVKLLTAFETTARFSFHNMCFVFVLC